MKLGYRTTRNLALYTNNLHCKHSGIKEHKINCTVIVRKEMRKTTVFEISWKSSIRNAENLAGSSSGSCPVADFISSAVKLSVSFSGHLSRKFQQCVHCKV
jgi:hypothetical protein